MRRSESLDHSLCVSYFVFYSITDSTRRYGRRLRYVTIHQCNQGTIKYKEIHVAFCEVHNNVGSLMINNVLRIIFFLNFPLSSLSRGLNIRQANLLGTYVGKCIFTSN